MGWERRKNGYYFYRSVRADGQPRKLYAGKEEVAQRQARLEAERRQRQQAERDTLRAEQTRMGGAERALAELHEMTDLLLRATLLAAGFHEHRTQWRRRRVNHKPAAESRNISSRAANSRAS